MKKLISALLISASFSMTAFSEAPEINSAFENVTQEIIKFSPQNTSMLPIQPEAHIGKFLPSMPPHLTFGAAVSGTFIDTSFVTDATKAIASEVNKKLSADFDGNIDIPSKVFMPTAAASARLGGFFVPFDLGIFFIYGNPKDIKADTLKLDYEYTTFGLDFRYETVEDKGLVPSVSFGAGYIYTKHKIGGDGVLTKDVTYNSLPAVTETTKLNADFDVEVITHSVYAQAQVSKKMFFFVPFIGGRLIVQSYEYNYNWKYKTTTDNAVLSSYGKSDSGSDSSKKDFDFNKIQPQLFAGFGLNLALFQIGFDGAWNPVNNQWSLGTQINFKL